MNANGKLTHGQLEADSSNCCDFSGGFIGRMSCDLSYDLGVASGSTCTIVHCAVLYVLVSQLSSVMLTGQARIVGRTCPFIAV
jgi:hypothetical protein